MTGPFAIVQCCGCGKLLMARGDRKTRDCAYCGRKLRLRKVKRLAVDLAAEDARMILLLERKRMKSRLLR